MSPEITGKISCNAKFTGFLTVNDDSKIHVNGFEVQAKKPNALKITYNGLEYELFDIEGHLTLNRVYK